VVTPVKTGIQVVFPWLDFVIPVCAGMTRREIGFSETIGNFGLACRESHAS
jgi:hypothetical protein